MHQAQVWSVRVCLCVCVCACVFCVRGVHAWVWMCVPPSSPPAQVWQRWSVCVLWASTTEFELQQPGRDAETESTEGLQHHTPPSQGEWEEACICVLRKEVGQKFRLQLNWNDLSNPVCRTLTSVTGRWHNMVHHMFWSQEHSREPLAFLD